MASFCVLTGQSPATYYALTLRERKAFVKAAGKLRRL